MTEKLTPEEVKKALECCNIPSMANGCKDCPLYNFEGTCSAEMLNQTLDLLNSQQEEIERLRDNNKAIMQTIADVHTEAIKEFADELRFRLSIGTWKHKNVLLDDCKSIIDKLVKEKVGEQNV